MAPKKAAVQAEDRNDFYFRGTITEASLHQNYVLVKLVTDAGGIKNHPTIIFFNKEEASKYSRGDRVEITAHMQIKITRDKSTGKLEHRSGLVGDRITRTPRYLCLFYKPEEIGNADEFDGGIPNDTNYGILSGRVVMTVKVSSEMTNILLETKIGEQTDRISLSCFRRQKEIADQLEKDSRIAAVSVVRTKFGEKDGRDTFSQFVVCKDICTLD